MNYNPLSLELTQADRRWLDVVDSVSKAAEFKRSAEGEGDHNQRVGHYSALISKKLGIPETELEMIAQAAQLHDLGTIFVPENILLKDGKLSQEEFEVMKSHVGLGLNLLGNSQSPIIKMARLIIETHHEAWDGSGYPMGLKGLKIPLLGQIVAVADVFDTLIHDQPYRSAWPVGKAVNEIKSQSGKKFDPQVVDAFLKMIADRSYLQEDNSHRKREVLLRGKLDNISIFDLLNLISQNSQSGMLKLYMGVSVYSVLIYEGKVINAEFNLLHGEDALVRIAAKTSMVAKVKFVFELWQGGPPSTDMIIIDKKVDQLLFDVAVKIDHNIDGLRKAVF